MSIRVVVVEPTSTDEGDQGGDGETVAGSWPSTGVAFQVTRQPLAPRHSVVPLKTTLWAETLVTGPLKAKRMMAETIVSARAILLIWWLLPLTSRIRAEGAVFLLGPTS